MKKALLLTLALLSFYFINAQREPIWGKISKAEKAYTQCSFDSSANAIILSEFGRISFNMGSAYIKIHKRIKVLYEDGVKYGTVQIPFFHHDGLEKIQSVNANTINEAEKGFERIKVENEEIYTKVINENWSEIQFTFPSVREGSILEYNYTFITKRITFLDAWTFQHEIPTLYSEIYIDIPSSLCYGVILFGDQLREKYLDIENLEKTWALDNIPGYEQEKHVFCYDDYVEKLNFQLLSYLKQSNDLLRGGYETVTVLQTWDHLAEDVTKEYRPYLNRDKAISGILDTLLYGIDDPALQRKKISDFVCNHFTWDHFYGIFPTQHFGEFLQSKHGSAVEINLLLCLLLKEAGMAAYPVLISTREHGKVTKNYPLLEQFNHVIVGVERENGYRFIDAATSENPYTLLPKKDLNYYGFLVQNKTGKWVDISQNEKSKEFVFFDVDIDTTGVFLNIQKQDKGYFATDERSGVEEGKKNYPELIDFANDMTLTFDSVKYVNLKEKDEPFKTELFYSNTVTKQPQIFYINQDLLQIIEQPYQQPTRIFPVELDFPFSRQMVFTYTIPDDYILIESPDNLSLQLINQAGKFTYKISNLGNKIQVNISLSIEKSIMPKEYYFYLQEFYRQIVSKLNEPIVIGRK